MFASGCVAIKRAVFWQIGQAIGNGTFSDTHLFYMFILGIFYQQQVRMARKQVLTGLNSPQVVEQ